MKVIEYNLHTKVNRGTEESPIWEDILSAVMIGWNEINEEIAKREAYNGEYEIKEYDLPEPEPSPDTTSVWDELDSAYREGVDSV